MKAGVTLVPPPAMQAPRSSQSSLDDSVRAQLS